MVSSRVCLVFAAPGRPAKALVDGLVVFADEVEQASDLGDGEDDQVACSCCQGVRFAHRWKALFFDLCLITARNVMASIDRVVCRYQAW